MVHVLISMLQTVILFTSVTLNNWWVSKKYVDNTTYLNVHLSFGAGITVTT